MCENEENPPKEQKAESNRHYDSHRGFSAKARQVLLEPQAPFAVADKQVILTTSNNPTSPIAPHRGFNPKAREKLIERDNTSSQPFKTSSFQGSLNLMREESSSEFDLRRRVLNSGAFFQSKQTNGSGSCRNFMNLVPSDAKHSPSTCDFSEYYSVYCKFFQ
ncbi:unnamed protein product [Anisakis simplex]|uniref:Uncharacterized protein n=1 Tax=Anisakis simplex TaxID=6269 RepID=A0A0M3K6Y7_ANISI|nr:unnamed protein product [Anisakis simplex]